VPHIRWRSALLRLSCVLAAACGLGRPAMAGPTRAELVAQMTRWTGAPPGAIVAVTPEIVVAMTRRGASEGAGDSVQGVEIEGEVVDEATAQARGWRSMRTLLDVGCKTRAVKIVRMDTFPDHDRKGAATPVRTPQGWDQPSPDAYLANVVVAVCDHVQPGRMRIAAAETTARPPPAPAPPPASMARTMSSAPPPTAPPPSAPAPAPPSAAPKSAAPKSGSALVQIAALSTIEEARAALKALTDRNPLAAGLEARIETATVHGRAFHRVQVTGFASIEAAQQYCASVRGAGGACFVR
jgi:cell division septation protein DedD